MINSKVRYRIIIRKMSFAKPKLLASKSSARLTGTLSYLNFGANPTSSFRSIGKTFDFHDSVKNAAPLELSGRMVKKEPTRRPAATWESLLASSRTVHEQKIRIPLSPVHKLEQSKTGRILYPELQEETITNLNRRSRSSISEYPSYLKSPRGITGCERKHDPRVYTETVPIPAAWQKKYLLLNVSADAANSLSQRLTIDDTDRIGTPQTLQIKDSTKVSQLRPYSSINSHELS